MHPDGGLFLFRNGQHIRYSVAAGRADLGYPRPYAADWPGVFSDRIDTALTWAPDVIYFFSANRYTSFRPARVVPDPVIPSPSRATGPA